MWQKRWKSCPTNILDQILNSSGLTQRLNSLVTMLTDLTVSLPLIGWLSSFLSSHWLKLTNLWCDEPVFMIYLVWTKRFWFSSKISILSLFRDLIRQLSSIELNILKNVQVLKLLFSFVLFQINACQNKKFQSCFLAEIVTLFSINTCKTREHHFPKIFNFYLFYTFYWEEST